MQGSLELVVAGTEQRYALAEGERLTIGRMNECEIVLTDQAVSRRHFSVEAHGETLIVTDLESANGTFVNERLIRSCTVTAGDTIRAGSVAFDVVGQSDGREGGASTGAGCRRAGAHGHAGAFARSEAPGPRSVSD